MKCLDDCHTYELDNFDPQPGEAGQQLIHFYRMDPDGTKTNGTTNEEVIRCLLHRLNVLNDGKFFCRENSLAITRLEEALLWLERRTANRVARGVEGTHGA